MSPLEKKLEVAIFIIHIEQVYMFYINERVDKEENESSIIMRIYTERGPLSVSVGQVISSEAPTV